MFNLFLVIFMIFVLYKSFPDRQSLEELKHSATLQIIIVNFIIFFVTLGGNLFASKFGNCFNDTIRNHQVYRLITSMFYHGNIMHLLCNMFSLINIGLVLELNRGKKEFLGIYFGTGILGGVISPCIYHMLRQDPLSVGASGAICGLLGYIIAETTDSFNQKVQTAIITLLPIALIGLTGGVDNICHFVSFFIGIGFSIAAKHMIK